MYKLDSFVTHNFMTELVLKKNNKVLTKKEVVKKDFTPFLTDQLKEYAVLLSPSVNLSQMGINLDYSISIPLTDVGVGVTMILKYNGSVTYTGR